MLKIHQKLEQVFKFISINRKEQIPLFIEKISSMGRFDGPKQNKVFALLLRTTADLEDEIEELKKSVADLYAMKSVEPGTEVSPQESTSVTDSTDKSPEKPKGGDKKADVPKKEDKPNQTQKTDGKDDKKPATDTSVGTKKDDEKPEAPKKDEKKQAPSKK